MKATGQAKHCQHGHWRYNKVHPSLASRLRMRETFMVVSLLFLLMLAGCGTPQSQWEVLQTGRGARMLALTTDPHNQEALYAGSDTGQVYRAFADNASSPATSQGIPSGTRVDALLADPQAAGVVYAGTNNGLFRSHDYAVNWAPYGKGLPVDTITALASASQGVLLAGMLRNGVYFSHDGGATWARAVLPAFTSVNTLLCVIAACYAGLNQSQAETNLYITHDDGQTWTPEATGQAEAVYALAALVITSQAKRAGQTLLFAGTSHGLLVSMDGGASWHADATGLPGGAVTALGRYPAQPDWLLAGVNNAVYRSTDDGRHWSALAPESNGLSAPVAAIAVATGQQSGAVVYVAAGQLARYPAASGGGNPIASIIALLVALAILPLVIYRIMVSLRRYREDHLPRRPRAQDQQ